MSSLDDVRALGYTVWQAHAGNGENAPVYFVSGFGISTYVPGDDQAQIDSLADPIRHAERLAPPRLAT